VTQEKGDDSLGEKVRDGAVEHAADRADAVVQLESASAVVSWPRLSSPAWTTLTIPDRSRLPRRTKSPLSADVWA
jgi:hypothetical protein